MWLSWWLKFDECVRVCKITHWNIQTCSHPSLLFMFLVIRYKYILNNIKSFPHHQMSDTVNPVCRGSSASTMRSLTPVIQPRPLITGLTPRISCQSIQLHLWILKVQIVKDLCDHESVLQLSPELRAKDTPVKENYPKPWLIENMAVLCLLSCVWRPPQGSAPLCHGARPSQQQCLKTNIN